MLSFTKSEEIRSFLADHKDAGKKIGFVPTMGALHDGHVSLITEAKKNADLLVCSIFVNPLQFDRKEDLDNYPNRINEDKKVLEEAKCDCLFIPDVKEIYPKPPEKTYNFGSIGKGMEADYRPGHFNGVAAVIERFFEILQPDSAFFGEKDYQQLAIVRYLAASLGSKTKIIPCATKRYPNGLAMSSRNFRLSEAHLKTAAEIYSILDFAKRNKNTMSPQELKVSCLAQLNSFFKVDYFQIADEETMIPLENWTDSDKPRAFVAAYLNGVRLIDNLSLID